MSLTQRISLVLVPLLLCAAAFALLRWKHESGFRPLYSALAPEDAAAVMQKVREAGIEYRLDESGSSVLVPAGSIAEARLALAGAGLPRTGRIGFEIFDRTNVGASDFTEQVNYRRALEGELERTVSTLSEIEQARVHITFAKDSVFLDSKQPAKATVVLKLKRAGVVQQSSVAAIANLMASSVDGLIPDAVTIVDSGGRLLNRPHSSNSNDSLAADADLDYRRQVESEFLTRINNALEPLVGAGHFHAGVNVDCDFTTTEQSDEIYDSGKSAILQSQTSEETSSSAPAGGTPGTASNLPHPPPREQVTGPGMTRHTENVSYQPGKTVRRTSSPKGSIRRVSTAVLVDQTARWEGAGPKMHRVLVPASAEVLKGVRDVVAGITGFVEQRGDQITVETVPFEGTLAAEPPAAPALPKSSGLDFKQPVILGGAAVILILVLVIGFVLLRRPRAKKPQPEDVTAVPLNPGADAQALMNPQTEDTQLEQQAAADKKLEQAQIEAEVLSQIKLPANTMKTEVLVRHIREAVQSDPSTAANSLRTWVAGTESKR